jgi:hypothetical protein
MCAQSGARTLEGGGKVQKATGFKAGTCVVSPVSFVEIDGEKPACLVPEHRIDTGHEGLTRRIEAGEMPQDDVVGDRKESAMDALGAPARMVLPTHDETHSHREGR